MSIGCPESIVETELARLEPKPLPDNIRCIQPGGGWIVRVELTWGRLRRWCLRNFRPGYVARMLERRRGECPNCPHDIIDSRDLKLVRNVCGYRFASEDDPFRWRASVPIARAGWSEVVLVGGPLILMAAALCYWRPWAAMPPGLLALFVIAFFRDPRRRISNDPAAIVAPADGTVTDVTELEYVDPLGGPAVQIGMFLSLFNVHVNRNPETARVIEIRYFPGRFLDTRTKPAARENEQLWTLLECLEPPHYRLLVKQIAGTLARRIVNEVRPGQVLSRGEKIGMIKFGSRTELFISKRDGLNVVVRPGDKLRGGSSIIARTNVIRDRTN